MEAPAVTTILVVDDEPDNYDVIESLLHREPYTLLYASSAERARSIVELVPPDLILLDVMMPEIDGVTFCRELRDRESTCRIPILMVTALDSVEALAECLGAGADDFLRKPVSGVELRARVRAHLRIQQHAQQTQRLVQHQQRALGELQRLLSTSLPHELRTPLTGILGPLQLLRMECEERGLSDFIELVDIVEVSGERMHQMVERLLLYLQLEARSLPSLSSIESPATDTSSTPFADFFGPALEVANLRYPGYQFIVDGTIPEHPIPCSQEYGHQLLFELLDNAAKFSPQNSTISLSLSIGDNRVALEIADEGAGLSPEDARNAGAFIQFDRARNEQQGIGLGIAIVRGILATIPGSQLDLAETSGTGTTWRLELPIQVTFC